VLPGWLAAIVEPEPPMARGAINDPYDNRFYHKLSGWISWCVANRGKVIVLTVLAFALSVALFRFVPQQFFPSSTRLELVVDLELAEGASLTRHRGAVKRFEAKLTARKDLVNYVAYVGTGSPRFYLPFDQKLPQSNFAQFVLLDARTWQRASRSALGDRHAGARLSRPAGPRAAPGERPPVGFPIQFRVSGEHVDEVRRIAYEVAAKVRANPNVDNVNLDWDEPSKVVRLKLDQERARALGVTSAQLALFLRGSLSGTTVSTFREGNELIEILLRGPEDERKRLSLLGSLAVPTDSGHSVPLSQLASLDYGLEDGIVWHRNRLPSISVRADIYGR
jgi:multidrug efflux pump